MHAQNDLQPHAALTAATDQQALDALRLAREMFTRTLAAWASDQLLLQRRGLDQPTWNVPARLRRAA